MGTYYNISKIVIDSLIMETGLVSETLQKTLLKLFPRYFQNSHSNPFTNSEDKRGLSVIQKDRRLSSTFFYIMYIVQCLLVQWTMHCYIWVIKNLPSLLWLRRFILSEIVRDATHWKKNVNFSIYRIVLGQLVLCKIFFQLAWNWQWKAHIWKLICVCWL